MNQQQGKDIFFVLTSLISLGTSISLWHMIKYQLKVNNIKRQIKVIQDGIQIDLDKISQKNLGSKIIIRGKVQLPPNIELRDKLGKQYISYMKYVENMYSNEKYDLKKGIYNIDLRNILRTGQVNLYPTFNISKGNFKLTVNNYTSSNYSKALEIFDWHEQKTSLSLAQNVQAILLSFIRSIATISAPNQNINFLRGIETGIRTVEVGIKVGTPLTILGTLTLDENGQFCVKPQAIFKESLAYLIDLKDQMAINLGKRDLWALLSILGLIYLGRRAYKWIQKYGWVFPWQLEKKANTQKKIAQ